MNLIDLKLYKALRKTGAKSKESLDKYANLSYDMGFDDFDYKIFLYFVETIFKINISETDMVNFSTVDSSEKYLRSRQN